MPRRNTKKQAKASKSRHASKGSPMMDTVSSVAISPTVSAPELEDDRSVRGSPQQQAVEIVPRVVQDTPEDRVPPPTPQHVAASEVDTIFFTCVSKSSGALASHAATPVGAPAVASANASLKTMSLVITSTTSEATMTVNACNMECTIRDVKTVLADVGYAPLDLTTWVLCFGNMPLRDAARLHECGLPSLVTTLQAAMPSDHQAPPSDAIRATSVAAITSITVTPARTRPGASPGLSVIRHNIRVTLDPNVPITGDDGSSPLPHEPVEVPAAAAVVPPRSSQHHEKESTPRTSTTPGATPTRSISQELEGVANTNAITTSDDDGGDHAVVIDGSDDDDANDGVVQQQQQQQRSCLKAIKERIKAFKLHVARGGRFA